MFLLDQNFPIQILEYLQAQNVEIQSTKYHGWQSLENGALASVAFQAGYRCILTRDRKFADSAAKALKKFPDLSVVVVTLKQEKALAYLASFREAWEREKIVPQPSQLIHWPSLPSYSS